ncbi:MAG: hypothetical protein AAB490_02535 [Patescibacteria group bacterium]
MTAVSQHNGGVIALILVIMVAALTVVYGTAVALMSIDETTAGSAWLATSKSRGFTKSCVNDALSRLRNASSLSGDVSISVSNVNCTYTISGSGNTRTVIVNGTSTDAFGRSIADRANVNVNISTNPFTVEQYKDILE